MNETVWDTLYRVACEVAVDQPKAVRRPRQSEQSKWETVADVAGMPQNKFRVTDHWIWQKYHAAWTEHLRGIAVEEGHFVDTPE